MRYKKCARRSLTLIGAAFLSAMSSFAITTWSGNYTAVTYASVTESTHGINSPYLGVRAVDSTGHKLTLSEVSWDINATTYEVDVTFTNSFTGTLYITGPWPSGSSAPAGFMVSVGSDEDNLLVCAGCETTAVRRVWGGQPYSSDNYGALNWPHTCNSGGGVTVFVYISGNGAVFGVDADSSQVPTLTATRATIAYNISGVPSGAVPLGSAVNNCGFGSVTDLRTPDN
ncbi:MAG: hypothetical protein ABSH32_30550 [Bryobacteraceae bacterium]